MIRTLIAAAVLATTAVAAHATEFGSLLADKSTITFTSRQMGVPVNGRFPKFSAQLVFDPAAPDAAKISVTVDTASIDAGSKDANDEVVGKPWFNVRMFPTATFTANRVKSLGSGKFEAAGALTIKGKSLPVVAVFTQKADGANGVFDGSFAMKRNDFGVGEGSWTDVDVVANEVQVNFHIVAAPNAAPTAAAKKSK